MLSGRSGSGSQGGRGRGGRAVIVGRGCYRENERRIREYWEAYRLYWHAVVMARGDRGGPRDRHEEGRKMERVRRRRGGGRVGGGGSGGGGGW